MYIYICTYNYMYLYHDEMMTIWSLGWDLVETCIDGGKMKDTLYHIKIK